MLQVGFPPSVPVGEFERLCLARLGDANALDGGLLLDFTSSTFVEMVTWQAVTALAVSLEREGIPLKIRVPGGPEGKNARDAMRAWLWPQALNAVSARGFDGILEEQDRRYSRASGGDVGAPAYTLHPESERTIPFHTWRTEDYRDKFRIVDELLELPEFRPIMRVLDRRLSVSTSASRTAELGNHVMSRIVFEAMTNALRHAGAESIQVSSFIRSTGPASAAFTIAFWDDGLPMWQTLQSAASSGRPISRQSGARLNSDYDVRCDNDALNGVVRSSQVPDRTAPVEHFMLAALFPGVSSDLSGTSERYDSRLISEEPELARAGMGLYALTRSAAHMFGGTVSFRTSRLFMNVKAGGRLGDQYNYRVKIVGDPARPDFFTGNLITVRLPLKKHIPQQAVE